jgi:3-deoxy-manno-octulosonate cytidylyltransferase (CMP-KDO synthetase)
MLQYVHERAQQSGASEVIIATDDMRIMDAASGFDAAVRMTSSAHTSGTERLAEIAEMMAWDDQAVVVNVQGDEPLIPSALIRQVAEGLASHPAASVATLAYPVHSIDEVTDPHIVKVVLDKEGYALYFSRAPIPCQRDDSSSSGAVTALRHIGLYAYRAGFLRHYKDLEPSLLEEIEKLEQLRVLWHGMRIHVEIASEMPGHGVDTESDLVRVEKVLSGGGNS